MVFHVVNLKNLLCINTLIYNSAFLINRYYNTKTLFNRLKNDITNSYTIVCKDEFEIESFGIKLGEVLQQGDILLLRG